jgi:hypothetical protein
VTEPAEEEPLAEPEPVQESAPASGEEQEEPLGHVSEEPPPAEEPPEEKEPQPAPEYGPQWNWEPRG